MDAANTNTSHTTNSNAGVPPAPPEAPHQAGLVRLGIGGPENGEGLSATYSPDDNKLRLYSVSRLDRPTYERIAAAGFRWAPKQGFFVAPMWTPTRADLLIELCGEIGDEDTSLVERAEDRADRFETYSDKRGREADGARQAVAAIADNIPFGQPILVGHHSERRARRDAQRIEDGMRRAIKLWDTASYWQRRTAGALRNAKYKELPAVRHRRIKGIEADKRKQERVAAEARESLAGWQKDGLTMAQAQAQALANGSNLSQCFPLAEFPRAAPASQYEGPMGIWSALHGDVITVEQARTICLRAEAAALEWAQRWIEHYDHRLAYERAMLDEQGGIAASRFDLQVGGRVLVQGTWSTIVRLNKQGEEVVSVSTNSRTWPRVASVEMIKDYQAPTAEAAAAAKVAASVAPLANYPGEGFVHVTQAQWDRAGKDYRGTITLPASAGSGRHRVRRLFGCYAYPSTEADWNKKHSYPKVYITDAKHVNPPKPQAQEAAAVADAIPAPERAVPQAIYQAPAPTEFDAMREQLRTGIKVVSAPQLFPTPTALARRMVDLGNPQLGQWILEPSSGTLRLLEALPFVMPFGERRQTGLDVVAVELQHDLAQLARQSGLAGAVHCRDFLEVAPEELGQAFDLVLMNPPFANAADVKHIRHAVKFLKPGGRLVAICAAGPRQHEQLQPLVEQHGGTWELLPADTFAESGTAVRTVLLAFTVPAMVLAHAENVHATSTVA